ncbi:MAG: methionyl-tRNA formyltransferase [Clostridia bacterium]|nr:methionyl-tRNA formyltransferase [Clostridia bacterium]
MRVVFMGTPSFAVPCLEALIENDFDVVGVFTQPDKPVGRKRIITPPEVKLKAIENDIDVYQPEKLRDERVFETIKSLDPELIVVVAYGKILPKQILEFPKYGCINIHGSLLPKLRGAAPIQWSVINGDKFAGVTAMRMDEGLDTGDMILQKKVEIDPDETAGELYDRLSFVGAQALIETIELLEKGEAEYEKQVDALSTYAPLLDKEMSVIDWNDNALSIYNKIRGLSPWPIAHTFYDGKKLKIYKARIVEGSSGKPGEALESKKRLIVACGEGAIEILNLQLEGKKAMDASVFLAGNKILPNTVFGE